MIWAFDHFHEGSINAGLLKLSDLNFKPELTGVP